MSECMSAARQNKKLVRHYATKNVRVCDRANVKANVGACMSEHVTVRSKGRFDGRRNVRKHVRSSIYIYISERIPDLMGGHGQKYMPQDMSEYMSDLMAGPNVRTHARKDVRHIREQFPALKIMCQQTHQTS